MHECNLTEVVEQRNKLYSHNAMAIGIGMEQARLKVNKLVSGVPKSFLKDVAIRELDYVDKFMENDRINICYKIALLEYIKGFYKETYLEDISGLLRKRIGLDYAGSYVWNELIEFRDLVLQNFETRFDMEFTEDILSEIYKYVARNRTFRISGFNILKDDLDKFRLNSRTSFGTFLEICILSERRYKHGKEKVLRSS
ncbi:hypothetical protein UT300012_22870 [Paraclostridium bifermentans]